MYEYKIKISARVVRWKSTTSDGRLTQISEIPSLLYM